MPDATGTALLELNRVSKSFGRVVVADELSFTVAAGDVLGIVRPNGAGKTSLFGLISGGLAPTSGEIRFDGHPVTRLDAAARLRRQASYQRAAAVLDRTGLAREANTASERLGLLQRKRLEVARALATGPRLTLLDEAAGGLTDPEVAQLVGIVRGIRDEGIAVVWIEHVTRALTAAVDRMICLAAGSFVADGRPAEVLPDPAVREVFLAAK